MCEGTLAGVEAVGAQVGRHHLLDQRLQAQVVLGHSPGLVHPLQEGGVRGSAGRPVPCLPSPAMLSSKATTNGALPSPGVLAPMAVAQHPPFPAVSRVGASEPPSCFNTLVAARCTQELAWLGDHDACGKGVCGQIRLGTCTSPSGQLCVPFRELASQRLWAVLGGQAHSPGPAPSLPCPKEHCRQDRLPPWARPRSRSISKLSGQGPSI